MDGTSRERIATRSADDIARIREAGLVVFEVLEALSAAAVPGTTTLELDRLAAERTRALGAEPAFKGYHGYPACLCISVNDEVVHGIPSSRRILAEGDVVGLDFGVSLDGWFGDSAYTVAVGGAAPAASRLLDVTREALARAIAAAQPDARLGDVGFAVQSFVESQGLSVVREFVGHGIGR